MSESRSSNTRRIRLLCRTRQSTNRKRWKGMKTANAERRGKDIPSRSQCTCCGLSRFSVRSPLFTTPTNTSPFFRFRLFALLDTKDRPKGKRNRKNVTLVPSQYIFYIRVNPMRNGAVGVLTPLRKFEMRHQSFVDQVLYFTQR